MIGRLVDLLFGRRLAPEPAPRMDIPPLHVGTIPKHCPGCGEPFPGETVAAPGPSNALQSRLPDGNCDRMPLNDGGEITWDCWCPACDWSGDILPDH